MGVVTAMIESKPGFIRLQIDCIFSCAIKYGAAMSRFVSDKFFVISISSLFRKLTATLMHVKVMITLAVCDALKSSAKCFLISPVNYGNTYSG